MSLVSFKLKWYWALPVLLVLLGSVFYTSKDMVILVNIATLPLIAGFIGGLTVREEKSLQFYLVSASLIITVLICGYQFGYKYVTGVDLIEKSQKMTVSMFNEALQQIKLPDVEKQKILESWSNVQSQTKEYKLYLPTLVFVDSLVLVALLGIVLRGIFSILKKSKKVYGKGLEYFRMNDYLVFLFAISWIVFLLTFQRGNGFYWVKYASLNCGIILSLFYMIQGLAIIKSLILKKNWPMSILILCFVVLLLVGPMVWLFLGVIFAGMGAMDFWADFRKLNSISNNG